MEQDYGKAAMWYQKAASRGKLPVLDENTTYIFGELYYFGRGVGRDFGKAAEWFRKAAEKGDAESARDLGTLAESGLWEGPDDIAAVRWYRIAAEHGSADAAARMGRLIRFGHDDDDDVSLSEDAP